MRRKFCESVMAEMWEQCHRERAQSLQERPPSSSCHREATAIQGNRQQSHTDLHKEEKQCYGDSFDFVTFCHNLLPATGGESSLSAL